MLVPRHPTPVGRRRAVAEQSVAWTQAATIAPGHVLEATDAPRDALPPVAAQADVGKAPPICFAVVYRLPEYLGLLREHLPRQLRQQAQAQARGHAGTGSLSWCYRLALRVLIPLIGTPMFLLKKRRMPVCRFAIDHERIERVAGAGTLSVDWADVVAVHRYANAYLVDQGDGGLPLPYRCLSAQQRAAFEHLLRSRFGPAAAATSGA